MDFRKKQKIKRTLLSRGVVILLVVLVFFVGRATFSIYKKARITSERLDSASEESETLEKRKEFLEDDIMKLNTEEGIEEEIRANFGFGKTGESVVVVVNPKDDGTDSISSVKTGFIGWFKNLFE